MAVGDDDRLDVPRPLAQVGEVRQDQVDADHLGGGEAQPDVDHDDPPVVLEHGHVLAYLAEPSEGQDADVGAHAGAPASRPWRSSVALTSAVSSGVASTSGRRSPPTLWPSRFRAAFVQVGFEVKNSTL